MMKSVFENQHFYMASSIVYYIGVNFMSDNYVRKTIKMNDRLWERFQEKVEAEYGTTYKHTSEEMEKAIENYIDNDVLEVEKTKAKIGSLTDENRTLTESVDKLERDNKRLNDELLERVTLLRKNEKTMAELNDNLTSLEKERDTANNRLNLLEKEVDVLKRENERLKNENTDLKDENRRLENRYIEQVEETNRQVKENTKIKNKREHAQERLNKTQDELNDTLKRLERYSFAIGQVKNMSFIDRLFNRLPTEIRELQPGRDENEEKKDDDV